MDTNGLLLSAGISGVIGAISPFLIPFLYTCIEKCVKREITTEEKRLVITVISIFVAVAVLGIQFDWVKDFDKDLVNFAQYFFVNFVAIKGMIQTIYELLIKGIPTIDRGLTKISS